MEMIMRTIKLALGALALMPLTACDSSETNNGATTKAPAALHAIGEVVPAGTLEIEAPRVSRRLQLVRRSIRYEQDNQQIFT
jgi:uncharacterized lipoprotein